MIIFKLLYNNNVTTASRLIKQKPYNEKEFRLRPLKQHVSSNSKGIVIRKKRIYSRLCCISMQHGDSKSKSGWTCSCLRESSKTAFHDKIVVWNEKATKFVIKLKWFYKWHIYLRRAFYPHSHRTRENVTGLSRIWFQSDKETFVFSRTTSTCTTSTAAAFAFRNTAVGTTLTRTHSALTSSHTISSTKKPYAERQITSLRRLEIPLQSARN